MDFDLKKRWRMKEDKGEKEEGGRRREVKKP